MPRRRSRCFDITQRKGSIGFYAEHNGALCGKMQGKPTGREACAEYVKRLSAFCRLSVTEVEEERLPERPSQAQIDACLAAEGKRLLDRVPPGAAVVALCIEGKPMTSPAFSALLEEYALRGISHVALVIGGSWGLSDEVKTAAKVKLSFFAG